MSTEWTQPEQQLLTILNISTSAISLIASLFVLSIIIASRCGYMLNGIPINKLSFRLIAALVLSDMIRSIGNLIGSPNTDTTACKVQMFLKIYGSLSSFLWMIGIYWTIYSLLVSNSSNIQRHQLKFHVIWLIAFIAAVVPLSLNYQSNSGGWCYIKETRDGVLMQFFCDYLWCLLTWIFSVILYIRNMSTLLTLNEDIPIISQIRYYPIVFFVCWLFAVVRRSMNSVGIPSPFSLVALQIVFTNLYGLCNAVVWGLTVYHHIQTVKKNENFNELNNEHFHDITDDKLVNVEELKYDMTNNEVIDIDLVNSHDN